MSNERLTEDDLSDIEIRYRTALNYVRKDVLGLVAEVRALQGELASHAADIAQLREANANLRKENEALHASCSDDVAPIRGVADIVCEPPPPGWGSMVPCGSTRVLFVRGSDWG